MSRFTGFSDNFFFIKKSDAITLNFLKKLDSTNKLIFHVSNLNNRVLDPPTHLYQFGTNCGKIQCVSDLWTKQAYKLLPNI